MSHGLVTGHDGTGTYCTGTNKTNKTKTKYRYVIVTKLQVDRYMNESKIRIQEGTFGIGMHRILILPDIRPIY
jgi:hypothetical protein